MTKKVLILSGSYGSGHDTAAQNLKIYYEKKWYKAKIVDILEHLNKLWGKSSQKFYKISSEEYPKIWYTFFKWTDYKIISRIFYWIKDPIWQPKFDKLVQERDPDQIISVFPFWNGRVKTHIKNNEHKFKRWIVITDAIDIQSFWYVKPEYLDKYFVFDEYTKQSFSEKFEIPQEKIEVSFFPILKEKFINKDKIWNKKIIMLLTGLEDKIVEDILKRLNWFDITVVKWRNTELFKKIKNKYNFKFVEFINILDNLDKFDLMIWKSWWAISCECVATNTPLIVPSFLPWQEKWNIQLLEKSGTWIYESNPRKIEFLIKYLDRSKLIPNFNKLKKENSCEIIEKTLL